ncbi:MAG: hypothetical protein AAGH41_06570 [Pseudomonadota bacterium]
MKVGDTFAFSNGGRTGKATVGLIGEAAETELVCFYVFEAEAFGSEKAKAAGFSGVINHVPIQSEYAALGLGDRLSEGDALPESFSNGHEQWKTNLRAGNAGWFQKSLPEAIDQIFSSMIVDGSTS